MAHGQSDQFRRAGWLAAACGVLAAVGCKGPDKDDPAKSLDPATKQKLMGLGQPPARPGTGSAALDQRFDRTVPTKLPSPQLTSANPTPPANAFTAPNPTPTGLVVAPTKPVSPATFGGPQPADGVILTGGLEPKTPPPLPVASAPLPPVGLPEPGGAGLPSGVLPVAPLGGSLIPPEPPPARPAAFPPAPPAPAATPLPGDGRESKLPEVPSFPADLPPVGK